ncbi:MAG: hypothetical protein U0670_02995 [Anaerolineae bacterium]
MVAYKAVQPNEEVHMGVIQSLAMALGEDIAASYMKKYGFEDNPDTWKPHQDLLNMFKEIDTENFLNIVAVGIKVAEMAPLPPEMTIPEALASLEFAYQSSHRNVDKEICHFEKTGERSGKYISVSPYPSDFEYGMVYGLVRKYHPKDSLEYKVVRDETVVRNEMDEDTCILYIQW